MTSDDPKDVAVRERLHKEAQEREVASRAYYANLERERGLTGVPGKTKFRPQRRYLDEAMQEAIEVDGRAGLLAHLKAVEAGPRPFDPSKSKIRIEPYGGDDERIGWKNVHIIDVEGYGVLGFCEGCPR